MRSRRHHRSRAPFALTLLAALGLSACGDTASSDDGASAPSQPTQTTSTTRPADGKPTVVVVHGAFAGPSSWDGVVELLEADGFPVDVVENPLRGPAADAAAVRAALDQIEGPVILVGHSYGGIAITNAATGDADVRALVYVAAYVPDEGDSLGALQAYEPPGAITPDVLVLEPYTKPDGTDGLNAHIKPEAFREVFAADLPTDTAATLAAQQMPIDAGALAEVSGVPAWRTIPSWYLVALEDRVIPPEAARRMAQRANASTLEIDASHAVLVSQPAAVVDLIRQAVGFVA